MNDTYRKYAELAVWAAIIVAVALLGRWAFSVDTHAQEGGGPSVTVTPTSLLDEAGDGDEDEKREDVLDCSDPGNSGHPQCSNPDPTSTPRPPSTRTPTPIPPPTKSPTPRTGPPIPFVPTEVPCPPGWTRGPCYAPGGTWTPTNTPIPSDDTPTPTKEPTATPIGSSGAGTGNGNGNGNGNGRATPTPTPKPRPTANPAPPFTATITARNGISVTGNTFELGTLQNAWVSMTVTNADPHLPNFDLSEWQFSLQTVPNSTGFYVVSSRQYFCDPNNIGKDHSEWTDHAVSAVLIIRCDVGDTNNTGFQVRARFRDDHSRNFLIAITGRIEQGWHRDSGELVYDFDLAAPKGNRPTNVPVSYYSSDLRDRIEESVREGTTILNSYLGRVIGTTGTSNVTIKTFWGGSGECVSDGVENMGCYQIDNDATGSYPHLREHEDIWFRPPPGRISVYGHLTFWSNDARDFDSPITKDRYYYLPRVVAHEFGHAFGAFHPHSGSRVFDDRLMGTYESGDEWEDTPTDGDIHAIEGTLTPH